MTTTRSLIALRGVTAAISLTLGCAELVPSHVVRVWPTSAERVSYPERDDPELKIPWLGPNRPLGVALSGGGTRAAAAGLGQLRMLHRLGWIDRTSYISAVSGGSWTAVPYTFLPPERLSAFLGPYVPPKELHGPTLTAHAKGSMIHTLTHAWIAWRSIGGILQLRGDESFSAALGAIFLHPFGLADRHRYFISHEEALAAALRRNPPPSLRRDDFLVARREAPFLVAGITLMAHPQEPKFFFPLEATSLYTGVANRGQATRGKRSISVGGGWLESFGYDTLPPVTAGENQVTTPPRRRRRFRFTLSDVMGASGAAPQQTLAKIGVDWVAFPEFTHWPIGRPQENWEAHHGDGGHLDNIGLLPLLARQVPKIMVFVNTATPFANGRLYPNLERYFRDDDGEISLRVIDRGPERLAELVAAFERARTEGRPLVHCGEYTVVANDLFAVGSYRPRICWSYLDAPAAWWREMNLADPEVAALKQGNFPHFRTFLQSPLTVVRLKPREANGLSNLAAWNLSTAAPTVADYLGLSVESANPPLSPRSEGRP